MARTTFCVGSESPAVGYCPISANDDTVPLWFALSSDEAAYKGGGWCWLSSSLFPRLGVGQESSDILAGSGRPSALPGLVERWEI